MKILWWTQLFLMSRYWIIDEKNWNTIFIEISCDARYKSTNFATPVNTINDLYQIACTEISLSPFTIYIFVFIIDIAASIMIIIMHYELMPLFVQVLSNFDLKPLVRRIYFHKNVIKLPPLFDFCVGDIFIRFYFLSYNIIA